MPQAKKRKTANSEEESTKPILAVQNLINQILDYEDTAREQDIDLTSGKFRILTATERDYLRAELVRDFIRLSAGNTGRTPVFFESSMQSFCTKVCDLQLPSAEIMGTYLAATEIAKEDALSKQLPGFEALLLQTMLTVLTTCAEMLSRKVKVSVLVPRNKIRNKTSAL